MKTNKETEEISGVTLNHFAEGKGHKTVSKSDLSHNSICERSLVFVLFFVGALDVIIVLYQQITCFHT